jgi:tight adherence protein C
LGTLSQGELSLEEIELSLPFADRMIRPRLQDLAEFISRFTPTQTLTRTRQKLQLAGIANRIGTAEFLAIRYVLMALFGLGSLFMIGTGDASLLNKIILIPALTAFGHFMPVLWLGSRIGGRKKEIIKALPDALDLLTICVEAGLGFNAAMVKVVDKWDNELSIAFNRVLQEIQLGKLRREALRDMADTMDISDMSTFVAAIIQAEQLGVSIGKVLRIQSDQMRVRRRQRAEEEARTAPIKIMIPAVFFIFPALFIVILGPAGLTMMEIFPAG